MLSIEVGSKYMPPSNRMSFMGRRSEQKINLPEAMPSSSVFGKFSQLEAKIK